MSSALSRCSTITVASAEPLPQHRGTHISLASLKLERVYEQNRQRQQKKEGAKAPELSATEQAKGKPRLLLMGQRRYVHDPYSKTIWIWRLTSIVGVASHLSRASSSTNYLQPRHYSSSQPPAYRKTA